VAVVVAFSLGALSPTHRDEKTEATDLARPAPSVPFLTVRLTRDDALAAALERPADGTLVVIQVSVQGAVRPLTHNGNQAIGADNLLGLELNWGDGFVNRHIVGEHSCELDAPLVEVQTQFVIEHVYAIPGSYTVTYHTGACDPVGQVTSTLALTVG
jgi:hypothetical protein